MGAEVEAQEFSRADRTRYREKVHRCLDVFERMLSENLFHTDDPMTGLEVELNLVDDAGDPALKNAEVLEAIADPAFQAELGQFNIEINVPPAWLSQGGLGTFESNLRRLGLGVVEGATQAVLEGAEPTLTQPGGRHVDLDVELAQLGLEGRVGDRLEHLGVLQRGVSGVVDEVELHLQPGHRVVGVEEFLAEHPLEHVEAPVDLLAVARAVGPRELLCVDVLSHGVTLGSRSGAA